MEIKLWTIVDVWTKGERDSKYVPESDHLATVEALTKRIEELEAERRWRPVTESLPEIGLEVLVEVSGHRNASWRNNHNLVAYLTHGKTWVEERHGWDPVPVTHWQFLPKAPQ